MCTLAKYLSPADSSFFGFTEHTTELAQKHRKTFNAKLAKEGRRESLILSVDPLLIPHSTEDSDGILCVYQCLETEKLTLLKYKGNYELQKSLEKPATKFLIL